MHMWATGRSLVKASAREIIARAARPSLRRSMHDHSKSSRAIAMRSDTPSACMLQNVLHTLKVAGQTVEKIALENSAARVKVETSRKRHRAFSNALTHRHAHGHGRHVAFTFRRLAPHALGALCTHSAAQMGRIAGKEWLCFRGQQVCGRSLSARFETRLTDEQHAKATRVWTVPNVICMVRIAATPGTKGE